MLQLIIFLALLPTAICTAVWLVMLFMGAVAWIFSLPLRLVVWVIREVKGV